MSMVEGVQIMQEVQDIRFIYSVFCILRSLP